MRTRVRVPVRVRGLTLIELMVALTIGSILVVGAVYVYSQSSATYRTNELAARLQDQARYVISVIEPDLELAGYYGFTNAADAIRFIRGGDPGFVVATAARMRQNAVRAGEPQPAPVPGVPSSAHACGVNFAFDVLTPVQGSNGSFVLGRGATSACGPRPNAAQPGADTLVIRRATTEPSAPEPGGGRLQIYASRLASRTSHLLFADGIAPGPLNDDNRVHDLVVRAYYVSRDSVGRPGFPALRVKYLTKVGSEVSFVDEEVMPGVEDLQVQFGIDTGDYDADGSVDPGVDVNGDGVPETDGRATRYVNPDFPDLHRYQVVSVRFWVRVRADEREGGFVDDRTYRYADVEYTPSGDERNYRRVLMSRTVALRNARTL